MKPGHSTHKRAFTHLRENRRIFAAVTAGLVAVTLLTACSVTEGRVTMVGGPPRVAVVNSPAKPTQVIEGEVEHVADGDCFVLVDANSEKTYAVAWPMNSEGGYSANETAGVHLESGGAVMSGQTIIVNGEVDLPNSDLAADLPELSPLCGADDGGWLLVADIDVVD